MRANTVTNPVGGPGVHLPAGHAVAPPPAAADNRGAVVVCQGPDVTAVRAGQRRRPPSAIVPDPEGLARAGDLGRIEHSLFGE